MKIKPYAHQEHYHAEHAKDEYHALHWEMGSGKTKAIIDNACMLFELDKIDVLMVLAINGVHTNWTRRQLPIHCWDSVPYRTVAWSSYESRLKRWRTETAEALADRDALKVVAINVEAFSRKGSNASQFAQQILDRFDQRVLLVLDESSTIKNPKVNKSKVVVNLGRSANYRRTLTGTPTTESPFNIFAQAQFLKPNILGFKNYYMFCQRYGQYRIARYGNRSFDELVCYRNLDELKDKVAEFSTEVIKSDCIDLPPKVYKVVDVEMTPDQIKAYKQMKELYAAEISGEIITVDNALTKLTKLHQITTGHIIDEDGNVKSIEHNRIKTLMELVQGIHSKTIIWCQYVEPIKEIMAELGDQAVEYSGRISTADREDAVDRFQSDPDVKYIVISLSSSGAYGLDLYAAGTEIYYCNGYSLERRMQSEERAHRPGQEHDCVTIIDMACPGTVDEKVMQAHKDKIDVASMITGLMQDWLR